jgi:hypothetical protein
VSGDHALNVYAIRSVGKAIWSRSLHDKVCPSCASGEPGVRPLPGEALGRGVNSSGDYCSRWRLGSDEVASLGRRGLDLNRALSAVYGLF